MITCVSALSTLNINKPLLFYTKQILTVPLQETAQRNVVAAIKIHGHDPRVHAESRGVVRLVAEAAEEDVEFLVVVGVKNVSRRLPMVFQRFCVVFFCLGEYKSRFFRVA